jgi:hypothetical protein
MTTPLITEESVLATETWREDALCLTADPELFYPDAGHSTSAPARKICASCPVLIECRNYALGRREKFGIWGGWTYDQRCDYLAGRPVREYEPKEPRQPRVRARRRTRRSQAELGPVRCGTRRGYRKHLRHGETPDQACLDANAEYNRAKRAEQRAAA